MDLGSLDKEKENNIFKKRKEHQQLLGSHKPYLSAIGALMFLPNETRPNIAFAVNVFSRHSSKPTMRHWNGVKRIFRYLCGTIDMGLYYPTDAELITIGYADTGYLLDPADAKS
jgi:hypothetical protein